MRVLGIILVLGLAAGLAFQTVRLSQLTVKNRELAREVAELQNRVVTPEPTPRAMPEPSTTDQDKTELLRLRNQAAQLRTITNELEQLRAQVAQVRTENEQLRSSPGAAASTPPTGQSPGGAYPREAWAFAGYATPENALQSAVFAMSQGDYKTFAASMTPEEAARLQQSWANKTPEQIAEEGRRETANITGFRVLEKRDVSPEQTVLTIYAGGEEKVQQVIMQKVGEEWKLAAMGSKRRPGSQ
jgi:cell division protein FtsB